MPIEARLLKWQLQDFHIVNNKGLIRIPFASIAAPPDRFRWHSYGIGTEYYVPGHRKTATMRLGLTRVSKLVEGAGIAVA